VAVLGGRVLGRRAWRRWVRFSLPGVAVLGRPGAAVPTRQISRLGHGKAEIF
jgi:hypothetical protein